MANNLKKFVNPKFLRTIDLGLVRRLLERHGAARIVFDTSILDGPEPTVRAALEELFAGPEEAYPDGLVADLHRIAELGNGEGLRLLLEQAARLGVTIAAERDADGNELRQDPKHVALRVFLDYAPVFDAASDMLALTARSSLAEYAGLEEGVEADTGRNSSAAFEHAAAILFEADHRGSYCRVGWYTDGDETNMVITHGSLVRTTPIVDNGKERVISYRAAEHAILSYSAAMGRLKIGGVAKARRSELAELFAATMLGRPGFFAAQDAQNLYSLAPIERAGSGFGFTHAFDPGIRQVQVVEAQANQVCQDPRTGSMRVGRSHVVRDSRGGALDHLFDLTRRRAIDADWRLNHVVIRVHFDTGTARPSRVTVKIKPPASAIFRRHRFEERILTLLRRNGLVHDRLADRAAVAAE